MDALLSDSSLKNAEMLEAVEQVVRLYVVVVDDGDPSFIQSESSKRSCSSSFKIASLAEYETLVETTVGCLQLRRDDD
jgi:hypothetical protein